MPSKEQLKRARERVRRQQQRTDDLFDSEKNSLPIDTLDGFEKVTERGVPSEKFSDMLIESPQSDQSFPISPNRKRVKLDEISGNEMIKAPFLSNFSTESIDFNTIPIEFATEKNMACIIWPKVGLYLYENDSDLMGPRQIETYWNELSLYLNDAFIYAFLCYIASVSARKTVVVDSLFTDMNNVRLVRSSSIQNAAFNFDANTPCEIILLPLIFPGHWALVIYDVHKGTFFIDSLQISSLGLDRIERIKNIIFELTLVSSQNFEIRNIPSTSLTMQQDGCSCGYFVCLYSESWLMNNCSLLLPNLDINFEKRRILWHINGLYSRDDVPYYPRSLVETSRHDDSVSKNSSILSESKNKRGRPKKILCGSGRPKKISFTSPKTNQTNHSTQTSQNSLMELPIILNDSSSVLPTEAQIDECCPIDSSGAFLCNTPIPDRSPDVIISPFRRSSRIMAKKPTEPDSLSHSGSETKLDKDTLTRRCHIKHTGLPCADVRAKHTTIYYDSGMLGDKICDFCDAKLLRSEAQTRNGKTSSQFCCNFGAVKLPPYNEHPPLLKKLLKGESNESKEFLSNQNVYNSLLAFASITVSYKESSLDGGICYLLNGEFVRQISSVFPGKFSPSFSQLYILDPTTALEQRQQNVIYGGDRVNSTTLRKLDFIIRKYHPLAKQLFNFHQQYQQKLEKGGPESVSNFRLTLIEARDAPDSVKDRTLHERQTNLPDEGNSLFAVWTETDQPPFLKGIWISNEEGKIKKFPPYHPMCDSLCYPLLFPKGDDGYHKQISLQINIKPISEGEESDGTTSDVSETSILSKDEEVFKTKKITIKSFLRFRFAIRKGESIHNIWSAGGGLSQKYALDYAARSDADVANYLRRPELNLRSSLPENVIRWLTLNANLSSPSELGSVVLFRRTHPGTRPFFQHKYYDATTIMSRFKKPGYASFFLTFTTNPRWPEISRNFLHPGQRAIDRFDLICRVFEDKLRLLYYLIEEKNIFGKIIGQECREFQKKYGGPHIHRIFQSNILAIPKNVENIIWAHIPPEPDARDKSDWANFIRKIRNLLPKYQMHDCGAHCQNSKGRCKKGFPKPFSNITILFDDKPAIYYRPSPQDGGEKLSVKRGKANIIYDNSRISSYNPYLLVRFETHHNVEFAYGQSTNLKYVCKYPFKGPSFSYLKSTKDNEKTHIDEPAFYAKMLYRSPPEAYSRIMTFKYARLSHTVIPLLLHLPGQQKVFIKPGQQQMIAQQIISGQLPETQLTSYWKKWAQDPELKNILFERMPETYSFNKSTKTWTKRKLSSRPQRIEKRKPIIGRIYPVSPRNPELFALYLLMKHFSGDETHLKTVGSHVSETFLEAARLRGLIENNDVWINTLEEGAASLMPGQMRQLFANILIFGSTEKCIADGAFLWERFLPHFYDTRCRDFERPARIERALAILEKLLVAQGRQCKDFGLPTPIISIVNDPQRGINEFFFPQNLNDDENDATADTSCYEKGKLNSGQKQFYILIQKVFENSSNPKLFHLTGDGGSGKTYLLNYILYQMRRVGKKVIPTASTGMASTRFYSGGTTVHSAFKFGIEIEPGKLPSIPMDSFFGRRIVEADLIIIDEMTMLDKVLFENIDALCRLMCMRFKHLPFGGKCVIISGDWKQSLPVVIDSSGTAAQVASCIQSSHLYVLFEKFKLTESMRVNPKEKEFLNWLDNIGTGVNGNLTSIPYTMLVNSREELIEWVFDKGFNIKSNDLLKSLLLATTNRVVDVNNSLILEQFKDDYTDYFSIDSPLQENPLAVNAADFEISQLNLLNPHGMPHHHLRLKVGSIIVLLVNLNTSKGLCNGTRLIIKKLSPNLIEAEAVTGGSSRSGIILGIPRYRSTFKDNRPGGVSFERFQFPVRIAFTMTIVKAQGQTCDRLGIDFTEEPFSHGQLYTALSRVTHPEGIKIYAPNKSLDENGNPKIRNIVASGIQFD